MTGFIQQKIARRFRALLCGDPSGNPPWLGAVAEGEGPGFFRPEDAPWVVHGDMATLVGGVRALLMQALHPGSLAGVRDHSRYKSDPLGRLAGTIQWLTVTTFASRESILREAARVRAMHGKVRGTYRDAAGRERPYDASDPELLKWVHIAFMDSFLRWAGGAGHPYVSAHSADRDRAGKPDPGRRDRAPQSHGIASFLR